MEFFNTLSAIANNRSNGVPPSDNEYAISSFSQLTDELSHNSEGRLVTMNNGHLLMVYQKNTQFHHTSATCHLVSRTSTDEGNTWSSESVVFSDNYDDRNHLVGVLPNGNVIVVFRRKGKDTGYVISQDNAGSWGSYTVFLNESTPNQPFGKFLTRGADVYFVVQYYTESVYETRLYKSLDNFATLPTFTVIVSDTTKDYDEPFLEDIDNGRSILIFRNQVHTQYNSTDGLNFTLKGTMNNIWSDMYKNSPGVPVWLEYIPESGRLLVLATYRFSAITDANNDAEFRVYSASAQEAFDNSYTLLDSAVRPMPNEVSFYGYPSITRISQFNYAGVITDRRAADETIPFSGSNEFAALYIFNI